MPGKCMPCILIRARYKIHDASNQRSKFTYSRYDVFKPPLRRSKGRTRRRRKIQRSTRNGAARQSQSFLESTWLSARAFPSGGNGVCQLMANTLCCLPSQTFPLHSLIPQSGARIISYTVRNSTVEGHPHPPDCLLNTKLLNFLKRI